MSKNNIVKGAILFPLFLMVFVSGLQAKDEYKISGTVVGSDEERVTETTVLLLKEDGSESQRTETSKKRFGVNRAQAVSPFRL